jgi:hypothetical protein
LLTVDFGQTRTEKLGLEGENRTLIAGKSSSTALTVELERMKGEEMQLEGKNEELDFQIASLTGGNSWFSLLIIDFNKVTTQKQALEEEKTALDERNLGVDDADGRIEKGGSCQYETGGETGDVENADCFTDER